MVTRGLGQAWTAGEGPWWLSTLDSSPSTVRLRFLAEPRSCGGHITLEVPGVQGDEVATPHSASHRTLPTSWKARVLSGIRSSAGKALTAVVCRTVQSVVQ